MAFKLKKINNNNKKTSNEGKNGKTKNPVQPTKTEVAVEEVVDEEADLEVSWAWNSEDSIADLLFYTKKGMDDFNDDKIIERMLDNAQFRASNVSVVPTDKFPEEASLSVDEPFFDFLMEEVKVKGSKTKVRKVNANNLLVKDFFEKVSESGDDGLEIPQDVLISIMYEYLRYWRAEMQLIQQRLKGNKPATQKIQIPKKEEKTSKIKLINNEIFIGIVNDKNTISTKNNGDIQISLNEVGAKVGDKVKSTFLMDKAIVMEILQSKPTEVKSATEEEVGKALREHLLNQGAQIFKVDLENTISKAMELPVVKLPSFFQEELGECGYEVAGNGKLHDVFEGSIFVTAVE